ncbi:MAG: hypothetical protein ACLFOC_11370 [Campylobacterales bacterium]
MASLRLPQELEAQLDTVAKQQHTTKTTLIKNAIVAFLDKLREQEKLSSHELGADLFGVYDGDSDLSTHIKRKTHKFLHEKHPHT